MKKQTTRAALALLAAGIASASAQETYSTWMRHRDVFLNTTNTTGGANVAANVTNFPVLVRLSARDSVFAQGLAGGADLRFTKEGDAVRLKHQVEMWDTATKTAAVWVLVDTVLGNNKTQKIRMHWGKAGAADSSSGVQVFSTANGFFNVWHLGDAAGISPRPSAVAGGDVATPSNFATNYGPVAGVIGKAESLRGGLPPDVSDRFVLGSGTGYSSYATGFTFSVWVKPLDVQNNSIFFSSSNGYAVEASDVILAGRVTSTDLLKFRVRTGNGAYSGPNTVGDIFLDQWQHFAFTRGGNTGTARIYKNGVELIADETMAAFAETARPNNYLGGSFSPNDNNYSGLLDEARLSKTARSADWLKLEYENQKPTGGLAFFDSAAPSPPPAPTLAYAPATLNLKAGMALAAVVPVLGGGLVDSVTVSPALPTGLALNKTTGQISGTPTAASASKPYVFTATNRGGTAKDTITVVIEPASAVFGRADLRASFSIRATSAGVQFRLPDGASRGLLTVSDLHGRVVWTQDLSAGESAMLSRSELPAGVYSARLKLLKGTGAGQSIRKSFTSVR